MLLIHLVLCEKNMKEHVFKKEKNFGEKDLF